ncbi:MAG: two component, sigma54 specific, transcriptional regulator, Fis family [Deltaproteobacteria bacterium]|nr:two component, sigma54 specific, transcriptional regulator, Fis family [Deltaproteobacteria bacterium]
MPGRILFIDDDPAGREVALFNLRKAGYDVTAAGDGREGLEAFGAAPFDLVVTDLKMPGIPGMEVLRKVRAQAPEVPVLVITAFGNVETAVGAMKEGAYDFIGKPFHREQLLLSVEKALERRRLAAEVRDLRIRASGVEREIVSVSAAMRSLLDMADRVARTEATVLISGESGTGKEMVARRIHARSNRAEGPFVEVNCAAIPAELLESELFGHVRGAFTGAVRDRAGRFRQASGGTLFLDEVAEIPMALQGKILRALQEKAVDAVGADASAPVDARILAATNRDLPERIRAGAFREDLYYRLNVVEIHVSPLRDRPEDIPPMARRFVSEFAAGREISIPPAVLEELSRRTWPGNVRELRNACERLVVLCRGDEVSLEDLPPAQRPSGDRASDDATGSFPPLPAEGLSLVDLERRVIEQALRLKGGNITQAAAFLRIPRHVLVYRLEKYGIRRDG